MKTAHIRRASIENDRKTQNQQIRLKWEGDKERQREREKKINRRDQAIKIREWSSRKQCDGRVAFYFIDGYCQKVLVFLSSSPDIIM